MNDKNKFILTKDGLEDIKAQLNGFYEERKKIAAQIKEARSYGDISENSEFSEVKERQSLLEGQIAELENIVRNAVIEQNVCKADRVCVGSVVTIKNNQGKKMKYTLVGATQADPLAGKISVESPVGKAMLDKEKGEEFIVLAPSGKIKMEVLEIA